MCGIVGYCTSHEDPQNGDALKRALLVLKHRGPDGDNFYLSPMVGLGHTRLAVIDVRGGVQPLFNEDESLATVVNGEFYNYRELNHGLKAKGHQFRTQSDSETLLHLYEDTGISDCLNRLNGMWAFALWDSRAQRLILARDRVGKKPLYYLLDRNRLIFASEIKALLEFPNVDRSVDEIAMSLYLKYGYIPAPYSIYKSIRKFPAAHFGIYEKGELTVQTYWRLPDRIDHTRSENEWRSELAETLEEAVRLRMVSDVPLGGFLSGGLDSSLIVSNMNRHSTSRVKTVCIGFEDPSYDESQSAELTARFLGVEHHSHRVGYTEIDRMQELVTHFDEPFADASFLPTWQLCRAAKEHVTVSLSGDGGDELFGGYRRYLAGHLANYYLTLPQWLRRSLIDPLVDRLPAPNGYYGGSWLKKAKLFVGAAKRFERNCLAVSPQLFENDEVLRLFPGLTIPEQEQDPIMTFSSQFQQFDIIGTMRRTDFLTYLADDILVKVDRMSMYHALEVRCPFLDHRVVELAFQIPSSLLVKRFDSKYILRRLAKKELLAQTLKKSKQGFMVPLDIWFRDRLKDFIYGALDNEKALWSRREALRLLDEHLEGRQDRALKLWGLSVLGMWANH